MRSYPITLVLEDIFDFIPSNMPDVQNLANLIFYPRLPIVVENCGTTVGELETTSYLLEGETELATGLILSRARIIQLLTQGVYQVQLSHVNSCTAVGGVCNTCYRATYPTHPVTKVGDVVTIDPEYIIRSESVEGAAGQSIFALFNDPTIFKYILVYTEGALLPSNAYSITSTGITLVTPMVSDSNLTVKYISEMRTPFLTHLSKTYAGSILGLKAVSNRVLPIRSLLLTSLVDQSMLDLQVESVKTLGNVPQESKDYLDQITDPLEKALFVLVLFSIFMAK